MPLKFGPSPRPSYGTKMELVSNGMWKRPWRWGKRYYLGNNLIRDSIAYSSQWAEQEAQNTPFLSCKGDSGENVFSDLQESINIALQ